MSGSVTQGGAPPSREKWDKAKWAVEGSGGGRGRATLPLPAKLLCNVLCPPPLTRAPLPPLRTTRPALRGKIQVSDATNAVTLWKEALDGEWTEITTV